VAQSVELTFDAFTDRAVTDQWRRLAAAGLPSAERPQPSEHHRPHLTLFAGERICAGAEAELPGLVAGLDLDIRIGSVLLFGPRRNSYVLVRQVVPSVELLALQQEVAQVCGADPEGQFGPGRWTPHVTLARRIVAQQVGPALLELGTVEEVSTSVRDCRRWDGDARRAWWLTGDRFSPDAEEKVGGGGHRE
jgi:2'-5' RNA ligase